MISLFLSLAMASELGSSNARVSAGKSETTTQARDVSAFAREMQIDPAFKPISFIRISDAGDLQMDVVKYSCQGGLSVTLLPTTHVAEDSFYKYADQVSSLGEVTFTEGVRPRGFYGPPFEHDDRLQTRSQMFDRVRDRLEELSLAAGYYRYSNDGKAPASLYDLAPKWSHAKVDRMFVDTWGHPFKIGPLPNGMIQISSQGDDGQSPVSIVNTSEMRFAPPKTLNDELIKTAREQGLVFEKDYSWTEKTRQRSADIAMDMIDREGNRLRNIEPVLALDDLLSSPTAYHPKSVVIRYGAEHMPKFEQLLTGGKYACKRADGQWKTAMISPRNAPGLTPAQVSQRSQIFSQIAKVQTTLEPNPFNISF